MNTLGRKIMNITNTTSVASACQVIEDSLRRHETLLERFRGLSAQIHSLGNDEHRTHQPCLDLIHDLYFMWKTSREAASQEEQLRRVAQVKIDTSTKDALVYKSLWTKERAAAATLLQENTRLQRLTERYKCCICYQHMSSRILFPCMHAQFCHACTERLLTRRPRCPLCRQMVERVKHFHVE